MQEKKGFTLDMNPRFFMYAKNGCRHSERAFNYIKQVLLKDVYDNNKDLTDNEAYFTVVDVQNKQYICTDEDKFGTFVTLDKTNANIDDYNNQLEESLNIWSEKEKLYEKGNALITKPQVFIHLEHIWYYVGGADDTLALATAVDTPVSDLLHLLPLGKEGRRTPPTQLKF
jgi:hypothetical protein